MGLAGGVACMNVGPGGGYEYWGVNIGTWGGIFMIPPPPLSVCVVVNVLECWEGLLVGFEDNLLSDVCECV